MLLYKYRSLSNLEFVLDILINERLYLSPLKDLNDPFEGQFFLASENIKEKPYSIFSAKEDISPSTKTDNPYTGEAIPNITSHVSDHYFDDLHHRVCSLSQDETSVQMWSLYADSHKGIAIEIDFTDIEHTVSSVQYRDGLVFAEMGLLGRNIENVLTTKTKHWDYEQEVRILAFSKYFPVLNRIKRILVGSRANPEQIALLKRITGTRFDYVHAELDPSTIGIKFPAKSTGK
ncbi:DUF2971 domain-containing protein [Zhongshania aliphaticivorans]|uniref:DUF2971 domain-containing protein n=1 Tax=Zhongshania aliphaticivorans TaxID=1470434 RepID=UPI0039C9C53A